MLENLPENLIEKALLELRDSDIPLFIYGGEKLARKIINFLDGQGITVRGFLINKKFWNNKIDQLYGRPIYAIEDYLVDNTCDLIVAFAGYNENQLDNLKNNIHKVYALDFIGALCMEEYYSSISPQFYLKNKRDLEWLENHLYDEKSRKSLEEFIIQRMTGIYEKENYDINQYFPDDIIQFKEEEVFLDCGAYHGENTIDFVLHLQEKGISGYKKIVCVEADKDNAAKMKMALAGYKQVEIITAGVWDKDGVEFMTSGCERTSRLSDKGDASIDVRAIDSILNGEKATYIKMDVEGSELKALYGAENTIISYKPKLAICIYHKPEDLIEIPKYIYSLRNDYKFYIRNYSQYGIETVLYAV